MQAGRRSCSGCRTQLTQIPELQDSVAKFPCAPGTALSHTQSHDFPSVSISSSISPGRSSHQAPFFLHFWLCFSLDNFSQKGKRIFSPLQLLISFSSYPSQSLLPSLLCCPEPPAQIQPGQLSQNHKSFSILQTREGTSIVKTFLLCAHPSAN